MLTHALLFSRFPFLQLSAATAKRDTAALGMTKESVTDTGTETGTVDDTIKEKTTDVIENVMVVLETTTTMAEGT